MRTLEGHTRELYAVAVHPNGSILTGSLDHTVRLGSGSGLGFTGSLDHTV